MVTRARSIDEIVAILRQAGANIKSADDLHVKYLGEEGYVGISLALNGRMQTTWIVGVDVTKLGDQIAKSAVAEWLTLTLLEAGGEMPVDRLMQRFLRRFRSFIVGRTRSSGSDIETLSALAYMAHKMGFITDPYDPIMRLPPDHPMVEGGEQCRQQ